MASDGYTGGRAPGAPAAPPVLATPYFSEGQESDSPSVSPKQHMSPESMKAAEAMEGQKVDQMKHVGRRGGVAAQSVSMERMKDYVKPVYAKSQTDKDTIKRIIKTHDKLSVLFGHLEDNALEDVVNAFQPIEVKNGVDIIVQGDDGDRLYIVNKGEVDIFVRRGPAATPGNRGARVVSFGTGSLVGELALMYSQPRAATVTVASETASLFALDRDAFQMVLASGGASHLAMYEGWLSEVPLFQALNHYEISRLADVVENQLFDAGEEIIRQGEYGDLFYIVEDGTCSAFIDGEFGEREVMRYETRGDYFGEIALLTNEVRKATVRATGSGCSVASLSKGQFTNLLGPLVDLLRDKAELYPQYANFLNEPPASPSRIPVTTL